VSEILEELDHTFLNNLPAFKNMNPTSENIARFIYNRLEGNTSIMGLKVSRVAVWESENSKAVYAKKTVQAQSDKGTKEGKQKLTRASLANTSFKRDAW